MLQAMTFETSRYSLQGFGEDIRIPCTAEELEKFIGCYFRMDLGKMPNQKSFQEEEDFSCWGFLSPLEKSVLNTHSKYLCGRQSLRGCENKGRR